MAKIFFKSAHHAFTMQSRRRMQHGNDGMVPPTKSLAA